MENLARSARRDNEKGEGGRSRATPSLSLLNPLPLGYAIKPSALPQSANATECTFNGTDFLATLHGNQCIPSARRGNHSRKDVARQAATTSRLPGWGPGYRERGAR